MKTGDCFEANARWLVFFNIEGDDWLLVHGMPVGTGGEVEGKRFAHAWLESRDGKTVLDLSNGGEVKGRRDLYYKAGTITEEKGMLIRYERAEVRKKIVEFGHWGHWELDKAKIEIGE